MWTFLVSVTALAIFSILEILAPLSTRVSTRKVRYLTNLGLYALSAPISTFVPLLTAYGTSLWAGQYGLGFFNTVPMSMWVSIPLSFLLIDATSYWQHRLFHSVPFLWSVHAVHHTDRDVDATTAIRHHPLEIFVSLILFIPVVALFGLPPSAVLSYMGITAVVQIFHHSNVRLPRVLSWFTYVVVTPEIHHVHHALAQDIADSNYSAIFPWWDKLFGTFTKPIEIYTSGIADFTERKYERLDYAFNLPLYLFEKGFTRRGRRGRG